MKYQQIAQLLKIQFKKSHKTKIQQKVKRRLQNISIFESFFLSIRIVALKSVDRFAFTQFYAIYF